MSLNKMIIAGIIGLLAQVTCAGSVEDTKPHFYLLSKVSPDADIVDKNTYAKIHKKVTQIGTVIYRNGQHYTMIIPISQIYNNNTVNFTKNGKEHIESLANFIGVYNVEHATLTGMYIKEAVDQKPMKSMKYSFKGNYGRSGRQNEARAKLEKKDRKLPSELVRLKQAAHMAKSMQKVNKKMAKVSISVTKGIKDNQVFAQELEEVSLETRKMGEKSSLSRFLTDLSEEISANSMFSQGAVVVTFKKY